MGLIEDYRAARENERRALDRALEFRVGQRGRPLANYQLKHARHQANVAARALADEAADYEEALERRAGMERGDVSVPS